MTRKRISKIISILLILIISTACGNRNLSKEELSKDNIKLHLENIINFKGRKIGSKGNYKTVEYIEDYFKEIGIDSIKEDTYTSEFQGITYNWEGKPKFNLVDSNGEIVKSYENGKDYKIRLDDGAIGGNFKGKMEYINKKEQIKKNEIEFTDQAVLMDYNDPEILESGFGGTQLDDRIFYDGGKVLIYPEDGQMDKVHVNLGSKNKRLTESGFIKLGVSQEVYGELINYYEKGYIVDIHIPISFEMVKAENVGGIIKGRKPSYENTLIIAAPIDGIGEDPHGKVFSNVSDSGISTSLLLEIARYMVENNIKVDSDVVFLGVNGGELGYLGYDKFKRDEFFQYDKSQVIYLDDLAGNLEDNIIIGSYNFENRISENNKLNLAKMANVAKERDINYILDEEYYNSKYMEFRKKGMITTILTYGENPLAKTLEDSIHNINFAKTKAIGELVLDYINENGNTNILKEIKGVLLAIYPYLILGIGLILFKILYINKNEKSKLAIIFKNKPIITIYLIGLFILFTMVLQTQSHIMITRGVPIENIVLDSQGFFEVVFGGILQMGIMILLITPSLGLTLGLIVFIVSLKNKEKISNIVALTLVIIGSYIFTLFNLSKFYNYKFSPMFPEMFSLKYSLSISLLGIILYIVLIIYTLSREKDNMKFLKKITYFVIIFGFFVVVFYNPYIVSKALIELNTFNGSLRF